MSNFSSSNLADYWILYVLIKDTPAYTQHYGVITTGLPSKNHHYCNFQYKKSAQSLRISPERPYDLKFF